MSAAVAGGPRGGESSEDPLYREIPKPVPSPAAANRTMAAAADLADPDSRAARTRRRILDAAAVELRDKGFTGTRLSNISKSVSIKAGAIYYYFHSLDAIVEEVIELGQRRVIIEVRAAVDALPRSACATTKILAAARAHLVTILTDSLYASASIRAFNQLPEAMRERQTLLRREYGVMWREWLEEGLDNGEFDPSLDPHATRMLILGALNWTMDWWSAARAPLAELLDVAEIFIGNALRAGAAPGADAVRPRSGETSGPEGVPPAAR